MNTDTRNTASDRLSRLIKREECDPLGVTLAPKVSAAAPLMHTSSEHTNASVVCATSALICPQKHDSRAAAGGPLQPQTAMSAVQAWQSAVQQVQELRKHADRLRQHVLTNLNTPAAKAVRDSLNAAVKEISQSNLEKAVCSDAACKEIVLNLKVGSLHSGGCAGVACAAPLGWERKHCQSSAETQEPLFHGLLLCW